MTYAEAVDAFILDRQISGVRDATITYYRYVLNRYGDWLQGEDLETARAQVMPYFAQLQQSDLTASTVHAQMRGLRAFFRYCAEYEICGPVKMPKLHKPKDSPTPLSQDEITAILKHLSHKKGFSFKRDYAIIRFFYDTGCRRGEALGIDMQDIDWVHRTAHITRKGGKSQVIPFGRATLQALRQYIALRAQYAPRYENALWVSHHGKRLTADGLRTNFRRISDATGIHLHPHKLRHSFAVAWILNGGDSFTLQAILGHESQEMTSKYVKIAGMDASTQHDRHSPGDRV